MVEVAYEGIACADCACWIANADDSGVHEAEVAKWHEGMEAVDAGEVYGNAVITCSGEDSEDCNRACEDTCTHCGRVYYGYFHPVTYLTD